MLCCSLEIIFCSRKIICLFNIAFFGEQDDIILREQHSIWFPQDQYIEGTRCCHSLEILSWGNKILSRGNNTAYGFLKISIWTEWDAMSFLRDIILRDDKEIFLVCYFWASIKICTDFNNFSFLHSELNCKKLAQKLQPHLHFVLHYLAKLVNPAVELYSKVTEL